MEKAYRSSGGTIFKITEEGYFCTLDIAGNWIYNPGLEYLFYDAGEQYEEIDINTVDMPKINTQPVLKLPLTENLWQV